MKRRWQFIYRAHVSNRSPFQPINPASCPVYASLVGNGSIPIALDRAIIFGPVEQFAAARI
ncbi:MAG TPA: hypothetical protein DEQ40_06855 [Oxalobacteraceae bacterium]|nr:hypothetical protein [Oxalobacteraceae bacterium]